VDVEPESRSLRRRSRRDVPLLLDDDAPLRVASAMMVRDDDVNSLSQRVLFIKKFERLFQ
jgi:hypothetical protein